MKRSNNLRTYATLIDSYLAINVSALDSSPSNLPDRSALARDGILLRFAEHDVARPCFVVSARPWT